MKKKISLLALALLLAPIPALAGDDVLEVEGPWVRAVPPVSPMTAGYLVLRNPGPDARSLVGARSPQYREVELHRTVSREGVARMVRQTAVEIPPGGELVLEPGSYHLMLIDPVAPLRPGDPVELFLQLADGAVVPATATVREGGGGMDHAHHHHHNHQ